MQSYLVETCRPESFILRLSVRVFVVSVWDTRMVVVKYPDIIACIVKLVGNGFIAIVKPGDTILASTVDKEYDRQGRGCTISLMFESPEFEVVAIVLKNLLVSHKLEISVESDVIENILVLVTSSPGAAKDLQIVVVVASATVSSSAVGRKFFNKLLVAFVVFKTSRFLREAVRNFAETIRTSGNARIDSIPVSVPVISLDSTQAECNGN